MTETLHPYYERELLFIRQLAHEFARQYPATAGRLLLESGVSGDPHTERLIESCALLAARVHHKLDDEFPELTDGLLSIIYPHYLAPIPSLGVVQFLADPLRLNSRGFFIERNTYLRTQPVHDLRCRYRTCYPTTLWPIEVLDAGVLTPPFPAGLQPPRRTAAAVVLQLQTMSPFSWPSLTLDRLRFHLVGETQILASLYELLMNDCVEVVFRSLDEENPTTIRLAPEEVLFPVGFERDEGLLPYPNQSFLGYRLLTEFFAFPAKFLFLDLGGFREVAAARLRNAIEVIFYLRRGLPNLEQGVDGRTFRLGCTPIINLFEQLAEPIRLTQAVTEYRLVPDVAYPMDKEVYSVDSVSSVSGTGRTTEYRPFYSFRHGQTEEQRQPFWYASRRGSERAGDRGTEVYLRLVDLGFDPRLPADSTLAVRTTCTNRWLPLQLQRAGEQLYFEPEVGLPIHGIHCPRPPTLPVQPPLRRGSQWRLVSHLSLNHLSISDALEGRDALTELLRLYDFADPDSAPHLASVNRHIIEGILAVRSRQVVNRTGTAEGSGMARGTEVTIDFDEQKYIGTGVYLFAAVLDRFLASYTHLNSFTQLIARIRGGERVFDQWPPRAGDQPLL